MSSENLNNLSIKDLKTLVNEEYEQTKKLRQEKREKLIQVYKKLQKQNEKLRQEKQQVKSKAKPKPKPKQKIKTFDEYFQECKKKLNQFPKILLNISKKLLNVQ